MSTGTAASLSAGNTTPATTLPEHIAFVAPTFTTAAYNNALYVFYRINENVPHGVLQKRTCDSFRLIFRRYFG